MEIKVLPDLSQAVAKALYERLKRGGNFGFPTGRTMDPIYSHLVELHQAAPLDPGRVHAFMVDEYVGLSENDPRSYHSYLSERVFRPLGITQVHSVMKPDYDQLIASLGGMDLQMLGLGLNGHIGFNEPGSRKFSQTRLVQIAESTRQANASLFNSLAEVPTQAMSIGVGTILAAKEVWVIASGASKNKIVKQLRTSTETAKLPASFLKGHRKSVLWLDSASASH